MVRTKITINKKLTRAKKMKRIGPLNMDLQRLKASEDIFQLNLKNRFEGLVEEINTNNLCEILREESQRLSKAKKTITKDKTQEDRTIKKLDEERKALRNKGVKSNREIIQYAELNKTVKKMRRTRARRKKERTRRKNIS